MVTRLKVGPTQPFPVLALVPNAYGSASITEGSVTTWDLRVYEVLPKPKLVKSVLAQSPVDHVFTTLQTGKGWDLQDGEGYNFEYVVASDLWVRGRGKLYRLEFKFNTGDTATGPLPVDVLVDVL